MVWQGRNKCQDPLVFFCGEIAKSIYLIRVGYNFFFFFFFFKKKDVSITNKRTYWAFVVGSADIIGLDS